MRIIFLICLTLITCSSANWLIGMKPVILPELSKPHYIIIDDEQLIVVDGGKQIHLYSIKNFKYQKQIFKHGEGPGEAQFATYVWTSPQYIYLYCLGKNLFFTRDGNYLKEFRTPIASTSFIRPIGEKFLCLNRNNNKSISGSLYDLSFYIYTEKKEMKYEKLLYSYSIPPNIFKKSRRPLTLIYPEQNVSVFENRIFICDSDRGLFVQVHDTEGNRLYQVRLDYEKIKVPENYAKEFLDGIKKKGQWDSFNSQFYYNEPEYFPAFFRFYVGKNKFYFLTYKRIGNNREVIICDWQGKNIKKAYIPWINYWDLRNYYIWNDKFYWLVDNQETEEWELHVVDVK